MLITNKIQRLGNNSTFRKRILFVSIFFLFEGFCKPIRVLGFSRHSSNLHAIRAVSPNRYRPFSVSLSSSESQDNSLTVSVVTTMNKSNNNKLEEQIQILRKQKPFKNLQDDDVIRIISRGQIPDGNNDVVPINSIAMQVKKTEGEHETILVIVSENDRIDLAKLKSYWRANKESSIEDIKLAPSEKVELLVGYVPGCIPPIGHTVLGESKIIPTILDEQLVQNTARRQLLGGGGNEVSQSLIGMAALLGLDHVEIANVSADKEGDPADTSDDIDGSAFPERPPRVISLPSWGSSVRPKPFFPVEPPNMAHAMSLFEEISEVEGELPATEATWVTLVGKISRVRQMSKRLVFCDFVPPGCDNHDTKITDGKEEVIMNCDEFSVPKEWRSASDGEDISVQLIGGKTLCQAMGEVQGQASLKRLQAGQMVLIQAKINVLNSKDSLEHWVLDRRLDLALVSYQVLYDTAPATGPQGFAPRTQPPPSKQRTTKPYLRWQDVLGDFAEKDSSKYITVVDDDTTVGWFAQDVKKILQSLHSEDGIPESGSSVNGAANNISSPAAAAATNPTEYYALIGLDCEWKPSFYLNNEQERQPVLLLQVNIGQKVYLLDLQSLLRPWLWQNEVMSPIEELVSNALSSLFLSWRLLKVGFQLTNDLQKMAASYPHVPAFQEIHAVVETATIAKKLMHAKKQKNVRVVTSSLNRMTEHFLSRSLNKDQQISDWSQRPLTKEQMDYAAMDAAITPALMRHFLEELGLFVFPPKPELGRWKGDISYQKMLTSWKFLFLQADADAKVIKKLKAKPILGNHAFHIVSQMWITGETAPNLPSVPVHDNEGPYTDVFGILRIPSTMIRIQPTKQPPDVFLASLVAQRTGKSKEKSLQMLLEASVEEDPEMLPDGSRLEYPPRSGYVEFEDGVALFVNMPERASSNSGQPRSYPNEWLDDGRVLTWFVRDYEWRDGTSSFAKKLKDPGSTKILFVRVTSKNYFLCCGRCQVKEPNHTTDIVSEEKQQNWYLVQLNLELLDWKALSTSNEFLSLVK